MKIGVKKRFEKRMAACFLAVIVLMLITGLVSCCGLFFPGKGRTASDTGSVALDEVGTESGTGGAASDNIAKEPRQYGNAEIKYFLETAMGAEYGSSDHRLHRWVHDIGLDVKGSPTSEDTEALEGVISDLDRLMNGITLDIVNWSPDIEMYFADPDRFYSIEPNYITGNLGFFWAWWDETGALYKARILIASEGVTQEERSHLIREELTQSLGIMNDSYDYEDSIFYQGWTDVRQYSEIDEAVISILYDPRLEPGMDLGEVEDILY